MRDFIVAVDPGGTCGIAWGHIGVAAVENVHSAEFPPMTMLMMVDDLLAHDQVELVVCESFVPRRGAGAMSWQPEAIETIGALRFLAHRFAVPFELQAPGNAKSFGTKDKLEILGWRNPTKGGHAEDALRHLLLAAVRHGIMEAPV